MSADHGDPFAPLAEGDRTAARRVRSEVRGGSAELTDKVVADCLEFAGTLAADYLAGRGIPVAALPKIDPRGDLLFHPRLWHKETKQYLPALVCRLRDETGQVVSAQRIFLQQGHPQRLDGQSAKKLTAPVAGAAVRLGKFDAEHAYLGEGVETTMSAAVVGPLALSLACCGSLRSDAVPASVRSVEILVDRGAEDRAKTVAGELQARGIEARLATVPDDLPDPEGGKADANTLLQGRGPQAVQAMLDAAVAVQEPRERALEHLAKLHPMEYDRRRSTEAKRLGVRVRTLDEEVARRRPSDTNVASGQGQPLSFEEPEPWEDEVEGASLLDDLAATFERYLALPPHASAVLALWVLHTYALSVAGTNPRLAIISPQKRCGKTTLISILSKLVLRPLPASNITPAAVFRAIDTCQPTLLLDEADTFLRENLELRGVLNSGHTRDTAFVIRSVGDDHEPRRFSTWCPMAIALIGGLPDTLADRSVVIEMRRRRLRWSGLFGQLFGQLSWNPAVDG
jgi:putative DNA primase/helicase